MPSSHSLTPLGWTCRHAFIGRSLHAFIHPIVVTWLLVASGVPRVAAQPERDSAQTRAAGTAKSEEMGLVPLPRLDRAIDRAASYLVRQSLENGQFRYRINLNRNVSVTPRYNILRHAGAMYSLAQYQSLRPDNETLGVLRRASEFLLEQIRPLRDVPAVRAVWSEPRVHLGSNPRKAKLGGTGLGLVALVALEKVDGRQDLDLLEQLGEFLLFMQKPDGSFYSFYRPEFPGRDDAWTSLYYPGEAALGLLMLNDLRPDPAWVRGAGEALAFLARQRAGKQPVPADHWALIATAEFQKLPGRLRPREVEVELLTSHAIQLCTSMLAEQRQQAGSNRLVGSFVPDGRTTPTATRLEGLLATHGWLPPEHAKLRRAIQEACHQGVRFLLRSQVTHGEATGGLPRAIAPLPERDTSWTPDFNARATEIRIDYVQHALSAWIKYRREFYPRD